MSIYSNITKILLLILLINQQSVKSQTYNDTILHFERSLYFADSAEEVLGVYLTYANYLKNNHEIVDEAAVLKDAYEYSLINHLSCGDKEAKLLYEQQLNAYYLKDYSTFTITYNAIERYADADLKLKYYSQFLNVLLLIDLNEWQEAQTISETLFTDKNTLDSIFNIVHEYTIKNVAKGRTLSIIPGIGQIYSGYWKEGIFSFSGSSAIGSMVYLSIANQAYFLGGLGFFPVFARMWAGGRAFTVKQIEFENKKNAEKCSHEIKLGLIKLLAEKETKNKLDNYIILH